MFNFDSFVFILRFLLPLADLSAKYVQNVIKIIDIISSIEQSMRFSFNFRTLFNNFILKS